MVTKTACIHHWIIEENLGSYSTGCCKKCGAVKKFKNNTVNEYSHWQRQNESCKKAGTSNMWLRGDKASEA